MITKKVLTVAVFFSLFFLSSAPTASAFGDNNRYFVRTSSSFVRKAIGNVRFDFDKGFSAELTPFQVKVARMFGAEVILLKPLHISSLNEYPLARGSAVSPQSGGLAVTVAVLDTGVAKHPDLNAHVAGCKDFTLMRVAQDSCADRNGHGTHVAGILVSQASDISMRVYKVCDDKGNCFPDDVAQAISDATKEKADIILIGFGSESPSDLIASAIANGVKQNISFVAAAGNGGPYPDSVEYPAALADVISVGAMDQNGKITEWSSRPAEVLAPGDRIESAWLDGKYKILSGTSMAAPYIAGRTARMLSERATR